MPSADPVPHKQAAPPKLAILFWYYKEVETCVGRLRQLRSLNPGISIYGLYGGNPIEFHDYASALDAMLDDNWAFSGDMTAEWKWRHGDLMLSAWHRARGCRLKDWDSLVIMQWDLLALAPIERIFSPLARDEIHFPGLRPISELTNWWWIQPNTRRGDEYISFKAMMSERYGFAGPYQACQFVTGVLPRCFLDAYADMADPDLGFMEYKMPAFASMLGLSFRSLPRLDVTWPFELAGKSRITLTAAKREIQPQEIAIEYLRPHGARLFHPVSDLFPTTQSAMLKLALYGLVRGAAKWFMSLSPTRKDRP
jgi:hypothetical protein